MLLRTAIRPSTFRSIAKSIPATPVRSAFNRPVAIAFGLSLGATPFLHPRTTARLDTSPSSPQAAEFSTSPYTHSRDARTPLTKDGRSLNPAAVKQISLGAILGLGGGVLLSAFSRMLTLIIGLGIVIWQVSTNYNDTGLELHDIGTMANTTVRNSTLLAKATTSSLSTACSGI